MGDWNPAIRLAGLIMFLAGLAGMVVGILLVLQGGAVDVVCGIVATVAWAAAVALGFTIMIDP